MPKNVLQVPSGTDLAAVRLIAKTQGLGEFAIF